MLEVDQSLSLISFNMVKCSIQQSPLKPQIPKTQITECICGYRNGTTKIANDGVIRFAIIIYIVAFAAYVSIGM